jgi:hypothetical protein
MILITILKNINMENTFYGLPIGEKKTIKERVESLIPENKLSDLMFGESEKNTFEIAPGMTVEQVSSMFFNSNAMRESPEPIYRLDRSGHRYYYVYGENGEPKFYPSITTLIGQTTPTSPFLIKWIADMGYTKAEEYKNERASYGTFMHGEYGRLLIAKEYDLDGLKAALDKYIETEKLPASFIDYADDLRKNMLSLAQFIIDVELEPLAVEVPLISRLGGFGCTLDLPCMMTLDGKRFPCIIDFKSGKHFYEDNEIQLHGCKMAWNENFETLRISRVFNWRPKDWRNEPTYELKEQTNSLNAEKLPSLLQIAAIEDKKVDNMLTICSGKIYLEKKNISNNYKAYTLAELVKKSKMEKEPEKGITKAEMTKEPENVGQYSKAIKEAEKKTKKTTKKKVENKADKLKSDLLKSKDNF